jgi:transcriptional regulator with XRE-family HTH domain
VKDEHGREPIAGPGISMSQGQIAKATGVSKAMIRNVERRAIRKIKEALFAEGFDPDVELLEVGKDEYA